MKEIENIVFDLGGVVIDLDRDASVEALRRLGLEQAGALLDPYVQRGPFLELETGRVTAAGFYDLIRGMIAAGGREAPADTEVQDAFNAFLVGLPVKRLRRILELRRAGYRVFALSNTNPVMYHSWIARAFRGDGRSIRDYFDGIVTSFEEGHCKPEADIFHILLKRYALDPARTLMLDDAPRNVEAASKAGMRARRVGYTPEDDMMAITATLL